MGKKSRQPELLVQSGDSGCSGTHYTQLSISEKLKFVREDALKKWRQMPLSQQQRLEGGRQRAAARTIEILSRTENRG
jgi:urease beta subunit